MIRRRNLKDSLIAVRQKSHLFTNNLALRQMQYGALHMLAFVDESYGEISIYLLLEILWKI